MSCSETPTNNSLAIYLALPYTLLEPKEWIMYKTLKLSYAKTFSLMFTIILLLNLNYTILKSVRKTLAIAAPGGSATSIPFFELFGVLPGAILMTWLLSKILRRFSMKKVFLITLFLFLSFFIFFAGIFYPKLLLLQTTVTTPLLLKFSSLGFYVVGELWKPALIQILFLGLINFNLSIDKAKGIYPSLILGASLGSTIAGPLIVFCNSKLLWNALPLSTDMWTHSLIVMMSSVFLVGTATAFLYIQLCKHFKVTDKSYEKEKQFSLKEALNFFSNSRPLKLMGWIVFADYIAYSLAEVLFFQTLKLKYPATCDFCSFTGYLSSWHSILTIFLALVVAPICLKKIKWVSCAIILPIGLLISEGIFFFFLCGRGISSSLFNLNYDQWLTTVVFLGSALFCVCRAVKYTIFEPCKELAFISLPSTSRMKGKLIIDGLCAKFGKGASSVATISFVSASGGLLASAPLTALFALGICGTLIFSTGKLGKELETDALNPI